MDQQRTERAVHIHCKWLTFLCCWNFIDETKAKRWNITVTDFILFFYNINDTRKIGALNELCSTNWRYLINDICFTFLHKRYLHYYMELLPNIVIFNSISNVIKGRRKLFQYTVLWDHIAELSGKSTSST